MLRSTLVMDFSLCVAPSNCGVERNVSVKSRPANRPSRRLAPQSVANLRHSAASFKRYDNYIGGEWRAPNPGKYFDNISPITGQPACEIARSDASDVEAALDAAHAAKDAWGRTSAAERAQILNKIADRMELFLEMLATAETWDNGKPIRETMAA